MRTDIQKTVDKQMLRYIIQRQITCPITGEVLDIDTACYFVDRDGCPAYVLSPEAYRASVDHPRIVSALEDKGLFPMEAS